MRATRLLSVLLLLQSHGRLTATQLAGRLAVSPRTIYRDVESLHAAGIPLYGEAGHAGGYQLVDGWRTRLTGLTADEADRLYLAGLPGPADELGYGDVVAACNSSCTPPSPRRCATGPPSSNNVTTWTPPAGTPTATPPPSCPARPRRSAAAPRRGALPRVER